MKGAALLLGLCLFVGCGQVADPNASEIDSGVVLECQGPGDCSSDAPVCSADGRCIECGGDGDCSVSTPYCEAESCVQCRTIEDCSLPGLTVCGDEGRCRGCVADDECESGMCDRLSAECVVEDDVVWVSNTGEQRDPCTFEIPCSLQQGFLSLSTTRSTMRILPGEYSLTPILIPADIDARIFAEGATLNSASSTEALFSTVDGASFTWFGGVFRGQRSGQGTAIFQTVSAKIRFFAVTFENADVGIDDSPTAGSDFQIYDSTITDNILGLRLLGTSIVERCTFSENGAGTAGGALILGGTSAQIRSNLFVRNVVNSPSGSIVRVLGLGNGTPSRVLANNTFADNFGPGPFSEVVRCGFVPVALVGNIFARNGQGTPEAGCFIDVTGGNPHPLIMTNNLISGHSSDYVVPSGNFAGEPAFLSGPMNYEPSANSPAIDRAEVVWAPALDFEAKPRQLGAGVDIGAIEHQP